MKLLDKKYLFIKAFTAYALLLTPYTVAAQFVPLTNIPGLQGQSINDYVAALFYIAIGIAAMFAVVKLVIAGAKYMFSDVANTKQSAIEDIRGSILGLLLILATVIILNTVNQNIVKTDLATRDGMIADFESSRLEIFGDIDGTRQLCGDDLQNCQRQNCVLAPHALCSIICANRDEPSIYVREYQNGVCFYQTSNQAVSQACEEAGGTPEPQLDGTIVCGNIQNIIDDLSVDPNNPGDFNDIVNAEYNILVPGWNIDANNPNELVEIQTECETLHGGTTLIVAEIIGDSDTLFVLCAE